MTFSLEGSWVFCFECKTWSVEEWCLSICFLSQLLHFFFFLLRWFVSRSNPNKTWAMDRDYKQLWQFLSCCACSWPMQLAKSSAWWLRLDRNIYGGVRCVPSCLFLPSLGNMQSYVPLKAQEAMTLLPIPSHVSWLYTQELCLFSCSIFFEKCILSLCSTGP